MTTTAMVSKRDQEFSEIEPATGAAITGGECQLTYDDALTRDEVVTEIEKLKSRLLEIEVPRV